MIVFQPVHLKLNLPEGKKMKKYLVQVIGVYDCEVKANSKKEAIEKANEEGLNHMILQEVRIPKSKVVDLDKYNAEVERYQEQVRQYKQVKLYTFYDENDNIIEQVRADTHDRAVARAVDPRVKWDTDFASETIND